MERFYDLSESDNDEETVGLPTAKTKNATLQTSRPKKRKMEMDSKASYPKKSKHREHYSSDDHEDEDRSDDEPEDSVPTSAELSKKKSRSNYKGNDSNSSSSSENEEDEAEEEDEELDSDIAEYTQDHELEETEVDHKWNELHTEAPAVADSTRRLAVCNMDWDFVKAQDLYILFKSFVPEGGALRSVTIYPSEYGKERMREEALHGPKEIREEVAEMQVGDRADSSQQKKRKLKSCGGDQQKAKQLEKLKESAQTEKLREYQLNRLRYYYAVVECDSVRTADNIYSECDGREYQLSSVRIDLRFIPDDMSFDEEPKERFSEEQSVLDYQPNKFNSTALSQAKVEVTWDETEFDRLSRRMNGLQPKELQSIVEENKYADIIAPPESDSEEEGDGRPEWLNKLLAEEGEDNEEGKTITEEEKIQLYRKVLMERIAEDEEEEKKEEGDFDKELAWQPGLKAAAEKKIKKHERKKEDNSIVGDYLEKKKEKKKKKKEEKMKKRKQENGEEEENSERLAFSDDDLPAGFDMEDMKEMLDGDEELLQSARLTKSIKSKKKKKGKNKAEPEDVSDTDDRAKAELELMLMDTDSGLKKKPAKPELVKDSDAASKKKKKKKGKDAKLKNIEEEKEDFVLDMEDPRFSALYSSHHFHIDPTAPQFKKTKNMLKLVDEQIKRKKKQDKRSKEGSRNDDSENADKELLAHQDGQTPKSKSKSQSLVESLKRKMRKK
ncbi:protein esf1 [Plakobranchus ocellatus]|uniref:Protein esf1 n=1 Tax=Plakobranchus ocellatus TaxID=259542 RepID=A0AAV4A4P6_9GAST|nr:protein esf1 [Plakobranchus ocellatus]